MMVNVVNHRVNGSSVLSLPSLDGVWASTGEVVKMLEKKRCRAQRAEVVDGENPGFLNFGRDIMDVNRDFQNCTLVAVMLPEASTMHLDVVPRVSAIANQTGARCIQDYHSPRYRDFTTV